MPTLQADRRLYVDSEWERVVEHGDPDAAFLLVCEGGRIDSDHVARFDLAWDADEERVVYPGLDEADGGSDEKMEGPPENKMQGPPENKSAPALEGPVDATDAARELAEERGLDLAEIEGTGKDGRVLKSDVEDVVGEG